jgi:MoxR-like ATPase
MTTLPPTPSTATSGAVPLPDRLRALRDALLTGLVERDVAIRLALIAALSGEHLLMVGPPGTAKSLVARRLHLAFADATYFERLLTRFSVPEELFGPLSIKGLEEDRYERLTDRYLPKASIAFLDEIFKANSAILNALLTLLNEREFDNGAERTKTPLVAVIGASNEFAEGEELDALFDRFLFRLYVQPVTDAAFPTLLRLRGHATPDVPDALMLRSEDVAAVGDAAGAVEVPSDVEALLIELRKWCTANEILVSDRRWRKIVKMLQVSALTNGRTTVSIWDCWLLQHCLWEKPEDRANVYEWYTARVGTSTRMDPTKLTKIVATWEGRLKADQDSRSQSRDPTGKLLYKGLDGKLTVATEETGHAIRGTERLYLAPARAWVNSNERGAITDRKNANKGYTLAELDVLYVDHYSQFSRWDRRLAYLQDTSNWLQLDFKLPAAMEPTRQKLAYIDHALGQVDALQRSVQSYADSLASHVASLEANIMTHLWVTMDFLLPAKATLQENQRDVEQLVSRLNIVRTGFHVLPTELPVVGDDVGAAES